MPVFANCTTRALFSVDMPSTARTLPLFRFSMRRYGGSGVQGRPSGDAVGKAVIRSRAAPIGISVTRSTGASLRAELSWRG